MGYFGRLWKRARNESGWTASAYTGTAAAGANIVSESLWCVVYGADVNYAGDKEKLDSLTVSTNFVNPLSSSNPSTLSCYLYTFDPTGGGDASVDAPPPGFYSAVTEYAEVGIAGLFCSFSFSLLDIRPGKVWLWFTSSVEHESQGSNQIYHYATGNYDSSLQTGTRTPSLTGTFTGSPGTQQGGSGTGYTVVSSGSYSSIFAQRSFSYTREQYTASRTALSFAGGGEVSFSCRPTGESGLVEIRGYLCSSSGFDTGSGVPSGTVLAFGSGGEDYGFTYQVSGGQTYYLWTVVDFCGSEGVPLEVTVEPLSWSYSLVNKGSYTGIARAEKSFSMSLGAFQTGRMTLSFSYSGQAEISVSASGEAFSGLVFVSQQQEIDSSTGVPLSYDAVFVMDSTEPFFIEKGKKYYFFAIYNGGSDAGTVSFKVTPPPQIWTQGGSGSYTKLANPVKCSVSLGALKYYALKASFAHTGDMWLSISQLDAAEGALEIYICESDCFDSSQGVPFDYSSYEWSASDFEIPVYVKAGKYYWFFIRNSMESETLVAGLSLAPPGENLPYYLISERELYIESGYAEGQRLDYYTYSLRTLSFRYRGKCSISVSKYSPQPELSTNLRGYLCSQKGMDDNTGIPTGKILSSYTGGGESFTLSAEIEEEREYYFYIVCPEILMEDRIKLELSISSPEARYYSITHSLERYGLEGSFAHACAPGESGVCRVELSFAATGVAEISARLSGGSTAYLHSYAALTPYLNAESGEPASQILTGDEGTADSPDVKMLLPVRKNNSYYVFFRGHGLYSTAEFEMSVIARGAAAEIFHQGERVKAQPLIYDGGSWKAVLPRRLDSRGRESGT